MQTIFRLPDEVMCSSAIAGGRRGCANKRSRWPKRGAVRHAARGILAAMLMLAPFLCKAEIQWAELWHAQSNGQHMSVEAFTSPLAPDEVARQLVHMNPAYQRFMVADARILLSGVASGAHWVAQIQGDSSGAQGYVSALYFDAKAVGRPHRAIIPGSSSFAAAANSGGAGADSPSVHGRQAGWASVHTYQFESAAQLTLLRAVGRSRADIIVGTGRTVIPVAGQASMAIAITMPGD